MLFSILYGCIDMPILLKYDKVLYRVWSSVAGEIATQVRSPEVYFFQAETGLSILSRIMLGNVRAK